MSVTETTTNETHSVNITTEEIAVIIKHHASYMYKDNIDAKLERMNYLSKRLKAIANKDKPAAETVKTNETDGWGKPNA